MYPYRCRLDTEVLFWRCPCYENVKDSSDSGYWDVEVAFRGALEWMGQDEYAAVGGDGRFPFALIPFCLVNGGI